MHILDNPRTYQALDPSAMRLRLRALPQHCREAWRQSSTLALPPSWRQSDKVVIAGMGGSAIAGDLVADKAGLHPFVPILIVRDFHSPFRLSRDSLVIVCSYSGNTEETLQVFAEAVASQARVVACTRGGLLAQRANAEGVPLISVPFSGEPRSAVGYNFMVILGLLHQLGLVCSPETEVAESLAALQQYLPTLAEDVPMKDNPAKQLAAELDGHLITVYGGGVFSGLARRWKTQFNENAKNWAFFDTLPELLHNTVESFSAPAPRGIRTKVVILRPGTLAEPMARRYRALLELMERNGVSHRVLRAIDGPPLAQTLCMLLLGDYTSYYLALLKGVDPSPIPSIAFVKERLSTL